MTQTSTRTWTARPRQKALRLVGETPPSGESVAVRHRSEGITRVVNVSLALLALIIISPLMLVLSVLIKLSSRGPVFYSQTRVGIDRRGEQAKVKHPRRIQDLGGQIFTIYKFRSMHVNAEHLSGAVWATREDPRVTLIGRFMRKYRLDELPQLLNVLMGDMNIVGPRPERPSLFASLRKEIDGYALRQRARPGITGLAQISQQYDVCIDDVRNKVHYDLLYISRQSMLEDFKIMLKTVPVILFKRGGW